MISRRYQQTGVKPVSQSLDTIGWFASSVDDLALMRAGLLGEDAATVFGDADRLTQMLRNLLENSARYTEPGGRVRVAVRREGERVAIEVDDSAPGVPREALARLFERFYRVDESRSRANGGAGLGLAISRSIAAAHGGEIAAAPSPLGGLRVSIRLPAAP